REVEVDSAVANRTGEPGRAGADSVGVSGRPVVFCGRPSARPPSSDRPALRRTGRGRRPDGSAGRSPAPWQGADDHHRSHSIADVAAFPQGEGTGLSSCIVDDAAARPPRARAWTGLSTTPLRLHGP